MEASELNEIVARLRRQRSDDGAVEAKACGGGLGQSVWESASAFANTSGGTLILGLKEDSGFTPAEGFDLQRVLDQFVSGIGSDGSQGRLLNPPRYRFHRGEIDDAPVLAIEIDENLPGNKPCTVASRGVRNGSYKRVDDKDILLSPTEIYEMQSVLTVSGSDKVPVPGTTEADLDETLIEELLRRKSGSRALRGTQTKEQQLRRLNVAASTGELTLAGLMVLGAYPQQYFPQLLVDVTAHPANEKSVGRGARFLDRVLCEGTLTEVIDAAVDATARNLRTYSTVEGSGRRDRLEIPREVLREAIANAVLHREYHELFQGRPVAVDIYPDRVEITSPGGLWGGKTLDNIDDGNSECRNRALLRLLQEVPLTSGAFTVEGQGSGVRLMIHEMQAQALVAPKFDADADQVRVTLGRHGAEVPEFRAWLREVSNREFTPHEDAALLLAKREGVVSVDLLQSQLRIDSDEARALLKRLRQEQLLRPAGDGRYALSEGSPLPEAGDVDVLRAVSSDRTMSIREIADATGMPLGALRTILRRLVDGGWVDATAPPTSRNRRYVATRGAEPTQG